MSISASASGRDHTIVSSVWSTRTGRRWWQRLLGIISSAKAKRTGKRPQLRTMRELRVCLSTDRLGDALDDRRVRLVKGGGRDSTPCVFAGLPTSIDLRRLQIRQSVSHFWNVTIAIGTFRTSPQRDSYVLSI
jgi:hypothetical protein